MKPIILINLTKVIVCSVMAVAANELNIWMMLECETLNLYVWCPASVKIGQILLKLYFICVSLTCHQKMAIKWNTDPSKTKKCWQPPVLPLCLQVDAPVVLI